MWEPKYSACFEGPLITNTLAVITRDMKFALDYFYPTENLPDFVERSIGTERGFEFPLLVIGPRENLVESTDDESHIIEPVRITINIGVIDETPEKAYIKIMKYVRALDSVLRSAAKSDYLANMTSSHAFALIVDVTHTYGPLGAAEDRTSYFKPASLELSLNFRER